MVNYTDYNLQLACLWVSSEIIDKFYSSACFHAFRLETIETFLVIEFN